MKIQWEYFIPIFITVAGGLVLWIIKIAIKAIGDSITRRVMERLDQHEGRLNSLERSNARIEEAVDYIYKTLIERNS